MTATAGESSWSSDAAAGFTDDADGGDSAIDHVIMWVHSPDTVVGRMPDNLLSDLRV